MTSLKSFLLRTLGVMSLVTVAYAQDSLYPTPRPLGGTPLQLGGGISTVIQTSGTGVFNAKLSSTFYCPTGPTNAAFTLVSSNAQSGQDIHLIVANTSTNDTLLTLQDTGGQYWIGTNQTFLFYFTTDGSAFYAKHMRGANEGVYFSTNTTAQWPTQAVGFGGAFIGQSNHVVYLLTSTPTSKAWAATNKLGP